MWLRILDAPACLAHNAWTGSGEVTLAVQDPMGFAAGRYRLHGVDGHVEVETLGAAAESDGVRDGGDVGGGDGGGDDEARIEVDVLASLLFGVVDVPTLADAGRVTGSPEAVARLAQVTTGAPEAFSLTFF